MDSINYLISGFSVALTWTNLYWCFIGCLLGTLIGVLPGIGPVATISILLPMTYGTSPTTSIIMLAGIYYGAQYGGSTTAILLNTPGEVSSVMTCVDGNLMTKQGRAGVAILTAGISSFIAGILTIAVMSVFVVPISELAFKFGPAEYSSLMLLGLVSASILTQKDFIKGLAMACLGVLLGLVGTDINTGVARFTFGWAELYDGIGFAIVAIGLFGIAESLRSLTTSNPPQLYRGKISLWPTKDDMKKMIPASLRGTFVGVITGMIPGGGASLSSFAAYMAEKHANKAAKLGTGAIEGVAAPEAANNASAQIGFIPLLSFGVPENAVMALMLSVLIMNGIHPGPNLVTEHVDLFWGLIASMFIGNIILIILNVPLVGLWVQIIRIPRFVLYPFVLVICAIGIYTINNNLNDILIAMCFGFIGLFFNWLELEPAPLILGLVLGPMLEEQFRRQMLLTRGDWMPFIERPISLGILLILVTFVIYGIFRLSTNKNLKGEL
jgi:putative tricarboxylic transport membrane protein